MGFPKVPPPPLGSWKNASRLLESPTRSVSSPTSLATSSHSPYHPFPWSWVARPGSTAPPFLFPAGWTPPGMSRGGVWGCGSVLSEKGQCPLLLALENQVSCLGAVR